MMTAGSSKNAGTSFTGLYLGTFLTDHCHANFKSHIKQSAQHKRNKDIKGSQHLIMQHDDELP
jgi:hypothetical protein